MKSLSIPLFVIIMLCISCDPPPRIKMPLVTRVPVLVLNESHILSLGDSLNLYFEIPQEVELLSGTKISPFYTKKDGAELGVKICKVDSLANTSVHWNAKNRCALVCSIGSINASGGGITFQRINDKKMGAKLHLIPKERGIYFLEIPHQGWLSCNDSEYEPLSFAHTYGNVPLNHILVLESVKKIDRDNYNIFLSNSETKNLPIYAFEVK